MKKGRLGLALGAHGLTASIQDGAELRTATIPLALPTGAEDPGPTLALALDRLRELGFGEAGAPVTVALLPPLVETKLITLPPLRPEEAEAVLRRDLAKHFLLGSTASLVGVEERRPPGGGLVLAAAAPRALAEAILRAVVGAGWRLEGIVPAHAAWVEAVRHGTEGRAPAGAAPGIVVAPVGGTAHLIRLEDGRPARLRRIPAADADEVARTAERGPGRSWVFGTDAEARALAEALAAQGWEASTEKRLHRTAAELAAIHAPNAGVELVPPTLAMARRDRLRRVAVGMGVAAGVLLVAAAGVQLWGANRALEGVRTERAELRAAVSPVLAAADSLTRMEERLASIAALEEAASGWTFALVELAVVLPEDVHLVDLRAAGDTLVLAAAGGRAGDALDALASASSFRDVRLEGAIQRDVEDGTAAGERFTLSAIRVTGLPAAAASDKPEDSVTGEAIPTNPFEAGPRGDGPSSLERGP